MNNLLLTVLKDIVVPELSSYIHDKMNKTGELPTQEELQQKIDDLSARITMKAENLINQIQNEHPELKNT